ncbi:MAG: hypothetical protein CVU71_04660 [Deltaproteobacteria bacterium HGW-Deltaproteobacteria-6]|jgi:hypothetical protein|nr:MAG: hypothetical protein CVU71_04660 [Deltaproteobacteria bacterium HGW-Deltaproteobacteria-6]
MDTLQNQGRQEIIYRYAAKKALQDLRNGEALDEALISHLNEHPLLGYCSDAVKKDDKNILKKNAAATDNPLLLRRFCLKLLRPFGNERDVRDFSYELWKTSTDYEIKLEVLWSLLSYQDLAEEIYADISRHFDAANWDKWLPLIVEKLEGDKEEKNHVKELMKRYFNL